MYNPGGNNNTGGSGNGGRGGSSPAINFMGSETPSRRLAEYTENVVTQRQNISAAMRLFERLLPALGYDEQLQKRSFKEEREKNLEMLKISHMRFGKLRQDKSNLEKELRKLKTLERMRLREGTGPSKQLNEAKLLVSEAIEKLEFAIDISEGEFKPLWLEVVRDNQIIKSETKAKESLKDAVQLLNSQFSSGHIFLAGAFVQLIPEIPFPIHVRSLEARQILSFALPLMSTILAASYLLKYSLSRHLASMARAPLPSSTSTAKGLAGLFRRSASTRSSIGGAVMNRLRQSGVLKLVQNLDLFIAGRLVRTVALSAYRNVASHFGGPAADSAAQVVRTSASLLANLDAVILVHAAFKLFMGTVMSSKRLGTLPRKIIESAPMTAESAKKATVELAKFLFTHAGSIVWTFALYRMASAMTRAFEGVKSIKVGLPGFRRMEEEDDHQSIKYDLLDVPDVSFDDVAGLANLRKEVTEIVDFLKESRKYGKVRAKCPKGVLMTGPPGCGKTLLAKAIAGEAGICFLPCVGSDFNSNIAGSGAEKMRSIWAKAEKNAPCILFIDEIDYVGSKRTEGSKGGAEQDRTGLMTVLLAKMDGINSRDDIFVIGTSNRLDILDPALLRPGRFDRHVEITFPDTKGRIEVLNVHARDRPFSPNVNLEHIARKTSGFSGAELANIINEAAIHAGRRSAPVIEQEDLESAYHKVILGVASERRQTLDYRKSVAVHEAGHAVLAMIMKKRFGDDFKTVTQVSILPRSKGSAGVTCFMNPQDEVKRTKSLLQADLAVGLGGRAAEEIWYGKEGIQVGASSDIESTTSLAYRMVMTEGMSSNVGLVKVDHYSPEDVRKNAHAEVKVLIDKAYEKAKEILRINEVLHRQMVYTLLREETIGEETLARLAKLYPPAEDDGERRTVTAVVGAIVEMKQAGLHRTGDGGGRGR
eukprot:CAMPEP_0184502960 /NCGR_PEP_ID=MMETSP0113_2-20130426/51586_1 /TAXON_ID=91329 /ORGANISM="Norrisiella sphaerica, Strain BC52" /LENGTH=932 /DNA_ID=CAMNT_0026892335 /DNA_START=426 /DNA_END=3225 /DNA_ORIENTATION=-